MAVNIVLHLERQRNGGLSPSLTRSFPLFGKGKFA